MTPYDHTSSNLEAPPKLAEFQHKFGQFLRGNQSYSPNSNHSTSHHSTSQHSTSQHSAQRVTKLYQELIFNNLKGFLDKCFPVCQTLVTTEQWQHICQHVLSHHSFESPYFTQVNQSFVDYLASVGTLDTLALPPYFAELAHYEWMELYVDIHGDRENVSGANHVQRDDMSYRLTINPTLQNLHYKWPVHAISAAQKPDTPEDSFYIVYRHPDTHEVQFTQTNALTHALVDYIDHKGDQYVIPQDTSELIIDFAQSLGFEDGESLIEFGTQMLNDLQSQRILFKS